MPTTNTTIDVIRTSASRPEMLKASTKSLAKHLKWDGELRIILHEDVLNRKASDECLHYATHGNDMVFDIIKEDDPPISQLMSLTWLINKTETPFFLNWEDDFEAVRDISLNDAVKILEENPDVNQIAFHKRATMHNRYTFIKREVVRSGFKLVTNPHWAFTPAVWRKSFIMNYWKKPFDPGCNPVWWLNKRTKQGHAMKSAKWIIKNTGHYFMGQFQEPAFVFHMGGGKSLREGDYKFDD